LPVNSAAPLILILATALALGCLIAGFHFYRRRHLIDDTPTSKTQGVFIGLTEVKGTAESETPLTSYLAASRCVYYRYTVQEHWRRTSIGAKGQVKTESGWKTVAQETRSVPIYLKDDIGVIRVLPDGAEVHAENVFKKECRRDDSLYYDKGPATSIGSSTHRRRFTEEAIPLHTTIYVIGQARERADAVAAEVAKSKNGAIFLISTHDEKHHSDRFRLWFWLWISFGLVLTGGGALLYREQDLFSTAPVWPLLLIAIGLYLFGILVGWIWTAYNSLVNLRLRVCQGLSQIDVELKRRADLIPNLVQAVEGFRSHERELQQLVTELRAQAAVLAPAGSETHGMSHQLSITVEKYPELKSSASFLALQRSLSETEQRLALARDYYNNVATFYRTRLETVPDAWLGRVTGFKPRALLEASGFERAPVEVSLAE
jgi:hypothetical protein